MTLPMSLNNLSSIPDPFPQTTKIENAFTMHLRSDVPMFPYNDIFFNTTKIRTEPALVRAWNEELVGVIAILSDGFVIAIFVINAYLQTNGVADGADPARREACFVCFLTHVEMYEHAAVKGVPFVHVCSHGRCIPDPFFAG